MGFPLVHLLSWPCMRSARTDNPSHGPVDKSSVASLHNTLTPRTVQQWLLPGSVTQTNSRWRLLRLPNRLVIDQQPTNLVSMNAMSVGGDRRWKLYHRLQRTVHHTTARRSHVCQRFFIDLTPTSTLYHQHLHSGHDLRYIVAIRSCRWCWSMVVYLVVERRSWR